MRVGAFELNEPVPELKEVHALAMLHPWIDVGNVGTLTLAWLETHFEASEIARLVRPGNFFDFTRYRPTIYYKEGHREVIVPNTYATLGRQKAGNGFLLIHLLEPHNHGEIYVDSVVRLLEKLSVKRYCLLGSMYDLVPHTRPLLVTGGGSGKGVQQELEKRGIESSDYQGPTSIASLVSQHANEIGIETMSLIVHLPQYTQADEDYMGTVRLMQVLGSLYNLPVDAAHLEKAEKQLEQINLVLEKNSQLKATLEQLETYYDERSRDKKKKVEGTPKLSPEVENFLSEMDKRFREG